MPDALLVTSSFLPGHGGIETYLAELCELVSPRLAVLAPAERDGRPLPDASYPTRPGPGRMLRPGRSVARAVVEECAHLGTGKVLFGTPWPLALIGPRLTRANLRYAVIVHGAELKVPAAIPGLRRALGRALAGADLLLPVSEYTAGEIRTFLQRLGLPVPAMEPLRARVDTERFRPGIDASDLRARFGIAPEEPVVACFGRLVRRKGVHRMVAAMPAIARAAPGAVLLIGGTGRELRRLQRTAARVGAPVKFAGRVAEEDAPAFFCLADVFVLPVADRWGGLDVEGLGVVLLEASACEVACVTGRSGGTPEAVIDGETGLVVDASSQKELVTAVGALLADRGRAKHMGVAGRAHVVAHFSAEAPLPDPFMSWLAS